MTSSDLGSTTIDGEDVQDQASATVPCLYITSGAMTISSGPHRSDRTVVSEGRASIPLPVPQRRRWPVVDSAGSVTLRHQGRLHHIGIGRAYAGRRVAMLIEGPDIEVVGLDGSPLRRLVIDPTKDYQRMP